MERESLGKQCASPLCQRPWCLSDSTQGAAAETVDRHTSARGGMPFWTTLPHKVTCKTYSYPISSPTSGKSPCPPSLPFKDSPPILRVSLQRTQAPAGSSQNGCKPLCRYWELNSEPLEKQSVLITPKPSLQPPHKIFFIPENKKTKNKSELAFQKRI